MRVKNHTTAVDENHGVAPVTVSRPLPARVERSIEIVFDNHGDFDKGEGHQLRRG